MEIKLSRGEDEEWTETSFDDKDDAMRWSGVQVVRQGPSGRDGRRAGDRRPDKSEGESGVVAVILIVSTGRDAFIG